MKLDSMDDTRKLMTMGALLREAGGFFEADVDPTTRRLQRVVWGNAWQAQQLRETYDDLFIFDTTHNTNRCVLVRAGRACMYSPGVLVVSWVYIYIYCGVAGGAACLGPAVIGPPRSGASGVPGILDF